MPLQLLAHHGWNACGLSSQARTVYANRKNRAQDNRERDRAFAALPAIHDTGIGWDALIRHARALDRSEAAHHLRVRHQQATRAQAHVRTAVGW